MKISEQLKQDILRGEELLWLCQDLQSEKDGVDRPRHTSIDKSKTLDTFAMDISRSATYMVSLIKLFPIMEQLAALGRKLELEGKITLDVGNSYSEAALQYILKHHGMPVE